MNAPTTRYAKAGDVNVAYQVVGDGPFDLVYVGGFTTHLEVDWEIAPYRRFVERLASFARVITFDKRGTGMSDPVEGVPSLEARMDDVRAVMDAAGSERAALVGHSEGAPMAILFAATYPERISHLVLIGAFARSTEAPDYPFAPPAEAVIEAAERYMAPNWGTGTNIEIFGPSLADDPATVAAVAKHERFSASPAMAEKIFAMFIDIDVREVLPSIRVPTLVVHRRGDLVVNRRAGKWLADQIAGSGWVVVEGNDHLPWAGDSEPILDAIQEFLTGTRHQAELDRVLATVLFTDIVDSTRRAAEIGDRRWRELLDELDELVQRGAERYHGRIVKSTGDGHLATFDGPARAVRCGAEARDAVRSLGIELRVGLHTGEIELRNGDVGGIGVHLAARVMSAAAAGEILVSSTVRDLVVGSGIEFEDRGTHELKGVPGEWRLFAVTSA